MNSKIDKSIPITNKKQTNFIQQPTKKVMNLNSFNLANCNQVNCNTNINLVNKSKKKESSLITSVPNKNSYLLNINNLKNSNLVFQDIKKKETIETSSNSNQTLCNLFNNQNIQPSKYSCNLNYLTQITNSSNISTQPNQKLYISYSQHYIENTKSNLIVDYHKLSNDYNEALKLLGLKTKEIEEKQYKINDLNKLISEMNTVNKSISNSFSGANPNNSSYCGNNNIQNNNSSGTFNTKFEQVYKNLYDKELKFSKHVKSLINIMIEIIETLVIGKKKKCESNTNVGNNRIPISPINTNKNFNMFQKAGSNSIINEFQLNTNSAIAPINQYLLNKTQKNPNNNTTNISYSADIYDSFNNDDEKRFSLIDQIQQLLIIKIRSIECEVNEKIKHINSLLLEKSDRKDKNDKSYIDFKNEVHKIKKWQKYENENFNNISQLKISMIKPRSSFLSEGRKSNNDPSLWDLSNIQVYSPRFPESLVTLMLDDNGNNVQSDNRKSSYSTRKASCFSNSINCIMNNNGLNINFVNYNSNGKNTINKSSSRTARKPSNHLSYLKKQSFKTSIYSNNKQNKSIKLNKNLSYNTRNTNNFNSFNNDLIETDQIHIGNNISTINIAGDDEKRDDNFLSDHSKLPINLNLLKIENQKEIQNLNTTFNSDKGVSFKEKNKFNELSFEENNKFDKFEENISKINKFNSNNIEDCDEISSLNENSVLNSFSKAKKFNLKDEYEKKFSEKNLKTNLASNEFIEKIITEPENIENKQTVEAINEYSLSSPQQQKEVDKSNLNNGNEYSFF